MSTKETELAIEQMSIRGDLVCAGAGPRKSEGEKGLLKAIMEQAKEEFQASPANPRPNEKKRELARQAREWLLDDEPTSWPFSFLNICAAMGLDPGKTRQEILGKRAA